MSKTSATQHAKRIRLLLELRDAALDVVDNSDEDLSNPNEIAEAFVRVDFRTFNLLVLAIQQLAEFEEQRHI
ncbi:MAG TPA: hypothetical protein VFP80_12980 [Thermoanaerobaculia bacterium]|nr:hypothetical protein [Thermoanaerobaculia bacterium]